MAKTTENFGLGIPELGSMNLDSYPSRLELEQSLSASFATIDRLLGVITGSHSETYYQHQSASVFISSGVESPYDGYRFADSNRVITKLEMLVGGTGSAAGGVTRFDVAVTDPAFVTFRSAFNNDKDLMLHVSGTGGVFYGATTNIPNPSWNKGEMAYVLVDSAVDFAKRVSVTLHWRPSSSVNVQP